ncbi:unnamed protein product, partial [Prorocentrum cordatum]
MGDKLSPSPPSHSSCCVLHLIDCCATARERKQVRRSLPGRGPHVGWVSIDSAFDFLQNLVVGSYTIFVVSVSEVHVLLAVVRVDGSLFVDGTVGDCDNYLMLFSKVSHDVADGDGTLQNCSRVRVFARVRPPNEADQGAPCNAVDLDEARHLVRVVGSDAIERAQREKELGPPETAPEMTSPSLVEAREFAFDGAFGPQSSQEDIFRAVGLPALRDCLAGINGTILAYGQTG